MTQRFEHKSTCPDLRAVDDQFEPQLEGWELCGVEFGSHVYGGGRIFYWKRPLEVKP